MTSSAYLLFYRRRSDRPLGGPALQEISDSFRRQLDDPDSQSDSRAQSPSGEGRRLGGSSRNGSSSALTGVGAAHQAGGGGSRAGTQAKNGANNDSSPDYSAKRQEGMLFDEDDDEMGGGAPFSRHPLRITNEPTWSFGQDTEAHGPSQMTTAPGFGDELISSEEELFDDDAASDQAVGGGNMSDSDFQLASLTDDNGGQGDGGVALPGTPMEEDAPRIQEIPPPLENDDDEELPVVELRVNDKDRIVSD